MANRQERLAWFREARLGTFIHRGVTSVVQRGTWIRRREKIPAEGYSRQRHRLDPS